MDDQTTDGLVAPEVNQAYDLIKQGPMGAIAEPLQRLSTGAAREQFTAAKAQQDREQAGLAQKTTAAQNLAGTEHQAAQAFDKLPPQPKYDVTPDTHEGLMGLAAILPLAGILLGTKGSTSGANALNAMTGVLKGYQEGNQQRIQFEKEKYEKSMDEWRNHYKMVQDGFQRAIEMAKTDYQAGIAKAEETAHRAGSPELLASIRANGIVDTMNKLQESNKYVMQAQNKLQSGRGAFAQQFEDQVAISVNEAAAQITNMSRLPFSTSGLFGANARPEGFFSAPLGTLANELTPQSIQQYNNNIQGLGYELAKVLGGGRVVPVTTQKQFTEQFEVRQGDKPFTVLQKLGDLRQKFERGVEVKMSSPSTTPEMRKIYERAKADIEKAIPFTVQDVLTAQADLAKSKGKTVKTFGDYMGDKMAGYGTVPSKAAVSPEDDAARQWAKANPNDPRSKKILETLGGQ